jgi:hypothetical protein
LQLFSHHYFEVFVMAGKVKGEKTLAMEAALKTTDKSPKEIAEMLNAKHPGWEIKPAQVSNIKQQMKGKAEDAAPMLPLNGSAPATNGAVSHQQAAPGSFASKIAALKEAVAGVGGPEEAKQLMELIRM